MKRLSIVIVSYNTLELLRRCLSSIYRYSSDLELQIIVVDNNSRDGSAEMVEREFPHSKLLRNRINEGFARAVNQGLRFATGDAILLLNSDVEIFAETLQRSLEFLFTQDNAGIVGCRLLNPDRTLQPSCESFPTLFDYLCESFFLDKVFPTSKIFGRFHLTYFLYDRIAQVDRVMGAYLLIRRSTFEQIGFLDETFRFYGEETDWCYRAKQNGWEVYFYPDAEVIHYGGQSADPMLPHMFVQLHAARFHFFRKYHGFFSSLIARIVLGLGALVRVILWASIISYRFFFAQNKLPNAKKRIGAFCAAFAWYWGLTLRRDFFQINR